MKSISRKQACWLMLLCLLVAASLRISDLNTIPPGLHYDEAANGTLAAGIGLMGERPIFISSYTGKEALFFYLSGGLLRFIGESVFALRLTSALVGLLSVAATYWMGQELFKDRRISAFAAILIGVSFWHLIFSRLGFRAITQPLLQTLAMAALFRGVRRQHRGWLIAGGVFLGLTAYTYLAARLFPILILLALLPLLLGRQKRRLRWQQLFLFGAIALAVLLPLLSHFASDPDAFWVRVQQVTSDVDEPALSFEQAYLKALGMFFLEGDQHWRFNVPGRPLFNLFWGALLVFGWVALVLRLRSIKVDWRRAATLLIILAPFLMILPSALATGGGDVPHNMRAIGLIPFVFFLPAVGLDSLVRHALRYVDRMDSTTVTLAMALLALTAGGISTYRTYFDAWATHPSLYYESDGDLTAVATFLDETDTGDATIYVSALHYRHPTLAFTSDRYNEIKWLTNSEAVVFPPSGPAIYIYPRRSPLPGWAMPYMETAEIQEGINGPDGRPAFVVYRLAQPNLTLPNPIQVNFDNAITLSGFEWQSAAAGKTMPVTLYWQVENVPATELTYFVHLQDAWQHRWSHAEPFTYPVAEWQPGETIIQRVDLPVPPGAPPGAYRLRVGLFSSDTGESIPRLDEEGRYAGNAYIIEDVKITAGELPAIQPQPRIVIDQQVRPGLRLLGYERGGEKATTGESTYLVLWWLATTDQPPLKTRLELRKGEEPIQVLLDTQPVRDTYPFDTWQTPQFVIDHVTPRIPIDFPVGDYSLNLKLMDASGETFFTADLGPLTVERVERLFEPPDMTYQLDATFGNEIALLGYEMKPTADDRIIDLQLVWQALVQPPADYTVFVHLLDSDGICCLWQQDDMPRGNQHPTGSWLAGEVVIDRYEINVPEEVPAGVYPIEVGLYIAESGKRLQVLRPNESPSDVVFLRPLQVGEN